MSRITILALLQTLLVILGFFALGIVLKTSGYPDALAVRWNPLAVFLRERGLLLLLLPILWTFLATAADRIDMGILSPRVALVIGFGIVVMTASLFFYAVAFLYTRPILFHP